MTVALISTVFNEEASLPRWIEALDAQTARPDEFIVVDGGSTDNSARMLAEGFQSGRFPKPRVIVQRCNIAEGRNIAIRHTSCDVVVSIDAGSVPDKDWLREIIAPFLEVSGISVVGGWCPPISTNSFQKQLERYCSIPQHAIPVGGDCHPSSRNVAFLRGAWESVGGYPEWLTLTAEDALFNANLHFMGARFYYQPTAIVVWEARPDLKSYLKMMKTYGFGSGEAGQATRLYLSWLATTVLPPLILLSRHPLADIPLRYLRNAASALGWIQAKIGGRKPPADWRRINGTWVSPQSWARQRGPAGLKQTNEKTS